MSRQLTFMTLVIAGLLLLPSSTVDAKEDRVGLVDEQSATWYMRSSQGETHHFVFGNPGDYPLTGDWDCDGIDSPAVYRRSAGLIFLRNENSTGVANREVVFSIPEATPLAGDWNGDGCDTFGFYRRQTGRMFLSNGLDQPLTITEYYFGNPGDQPFAGDFDGDGADELALHREQSGVTYMRFTHTQGPADHMFVFGNPGDCRIAGDWNDDGRDTVGLFRPADSHFYLRDTNSTGIHDVTFDYGTPSMLPISGHFGVAGGDVELKGGGIVECTSQRRLALGAIGSGELDVVPGESEVHGQGDLHRFRVEVEEGLPIDSLFFADVVEAVLFDVRGWIGTGHDAFQRVDGAADLRILLTDPQTTTELCRPLDVHQTLSCRVGDMVVLNFFRWTEAAEPFGGDLATYRRYLVNHEVGHWLGKSHRSCPNSGAAAPVMMQQSKSVGGCVPNGWPTDDELD